MIVAAGRRPRTRRRKLDVRIVTFCSCPSVCPKMSFTPAATVATYVLSGSSAYGSIAIDVRGIGTPSGDGNRRRCRRDRHRADDRLRIERIAERNRGIAVGESAAAVRARLGRRHDARADRRCECRAVEGLRRCDDFRTTGATPGAMLQRVLRFRRARSRAGLQIVDPRVERRIEELLRVAAGIGVGCACSVAVTFTLSPPPSSVALSRQRVGVDGGVGRHLQRRAQTRRARACSSSVACSCGRPRSSTGAVANVHARS